MVLSNFGDQDIREFHKGYSEISQGIPEAEFLSDEYFEQWYQNVLSKLQAYEG